MKNERRKIGAVTPEERDEIKALFERKNAISELLRALAESDCEELSYSNIYDRMVEDLDEVATRSQGWWDEKSVKYDWEKFKGCSWNIDFNTCDIYLQKHNRGGSEP
jgi:CXXX repeat modification system protein